MGNQLEQCKAQREITDNHKDKGTTTPNSNTNLSFCNSHRPCFAEQDSYQRIYQQKNNARLSLQPQLHKSLINRPQEHTKKSTQSFATNTINQKKLLTVEAYNHRKALSSTIIAKLGLRGDFVEGLSPEQNEVLKQKKFRMAQTITNICLNDQTHLIDIIYELKTRSNCNPKTVPNELFDFVNAVEKTELDQLDMFFHNEQQIFMNPHLSYQNDIRNNIIDLRQVITEESEFPGSPALKYEKYKRIGLDMIRNGKVCFFVMAAGKSSRFLISQPPKRTSRSSLNSSTLGENNNTASNKQSRNGNEKSKQFQPLEIPSGRSILEIIIHRFIALAQKYDCHLTIYLCISASQISSLQQLVSNISTSRLTFYPFTSKILGALDPEGKVVIEDRYRPSLWPVGSGDIWNVLTGDKTLNFPNIEQLLARGFQYIQFLGTSNALEKCFDCFATGLAKEEDLDWTTKVVESTFLQHTFRKTSGTQEDAFQTKIFQNYNSEIYVCDPQQKQNYPNNNCSHTFINSSLFKLSYLQKALRSPEWDRLLPRKKVHTVNNVPPFSRYQSIISYERDYTDIFRLTKISHSYQPQRADCFSEPTRYTYQEPIRYAQQARGTGSCLHPSQSSSNVMVKDQPRWKLIRCGRQDYYPFIYHTYKCADIGNASAAIMQLHRMYLHLHKQVKIEIDPYISLEGQDLEGIIQDIDQSQLNTDDQIFIEKKVTP